MSRSQSVVDDPTAYPPYQSRPGLVGSDVGATPGPTGQGARALSSTGSAAVATHAGEGDFLQAAQGIQLTKEDKQEGYDAALLSLPERNTTAPAPVPSYPRPFGHPSDEPSTLPAALPYATRVRDDDLVDLDGKRRNTGPTRGGSGSRRKGVRHDPASASHDHHRSRKPGTRQSGEKGRAKNSRRRKRQLKWYQKPIALAALLVLVLVVAVAVGLGVGLTQDNKKDNNNNTGTSSGSTASSTQSNPVTIPSGSSASDGDGTVQVSVSANADSEQTGAQIMQPTAAADAISPTIAVRAAPAQPSLSVVHEPEPVLTRRRRARWV